MVCYFHAKLSFKTTRNSPAMFCWSSSASNAPLSSNSLGFQTVFGLFLWATGCARQTIDALRNCGFSVCYNRAFFLSARCIELAVEVGSGIHIFCYDNINLSTSVFVEQRGAFSPAKVTSGTFAVLYEVRNGNPEHIKLAPIMNRFKQLKRGLKFKYDLCPSPIQRQSFLFQLKVVLVLVLSKYVTKFGAYSDRQALQHKPRRPLPKWYVTKQYPLRTTTIEEATVRGNLLFHDDIYITQLKQPKDRLSVYAWSTYKLPNTVGTKSSCSRRQSMGTTRGFSTRFWSLSSLSQLGMVALTCSSRLCWRDWKPDWRSKAQVILACYFNKKNFALINGRAYEQEVDTIPDLQMSIGTEGTNVGM